MLLKRTGIGGHIRCSNTSHQGQKGWFEGYNTGQPSRLAVDGMRRYSYHHENSTSV